MTPADDRALRHLGRLKLRAGWRRQVRKLKTPQGVLLALLGAGIFVAWIGGVALWSGIGEGVAVDAAAVRPVVRVGALFFFGISLFGALQHRGLYLPAEEIERLFSGPLSRAAITRYRMRATLARAAFGGAILGLMVMPRMPVPVFAFLGALSAVAAVSIVGQMLSILAGALEKRFVQRWLKGPGRIAFLVLLVGGMLLFWSLVFGVEQEDGAPGPFAAFLAERVPAHERVVGALSNGWIRAVTLPFEPWVRAITAESLVEFTTWFPATLILIFLLHRGTALLPIDYRELSLETAASVADRLRRLRRVGGGASSSTVSRRTRALRVPFLFGRGPAGALAWRKSTEIVRKARGTLWVSALVLALILFISGMVADRGRPEDVLGQCVTLALMGIVYLCSGLRFDFRDDLDRMGTIRSWPLSPTKVFVATLLPEFALVTLLLWGAIAARVAMTGAFHPAVLAVVASVPPAVFAWLALDNAVFLVAPVRFVPGQEGALQNAGRMVVLVFLRMVAVGAVAAVVGLAGAGTWFAARQLGATREVAIGAAGVVGWALLVGADLLLAFIGGWAFQRFDVARDRG